MMEAEKASETLEYSIILTRLVARENFIAFSRSESFKLCFLIACLFKYLCIFSLFVCLSLIMFSVIIFLFLCFFCLCSLFSLCLYCLSFFLCSFLFLSIFLALCLCCPEPTTMPLQFSVMRGV